MNMSPTAQILSESNPYAKCPMCQGRGELPVQRHHGPDLTICNTCGGQGELRLADAVNQQEFLDAKVAY